MDEHNQSWIGRSLSVTSSTDPTLVGRKGIVVNETRNTIALLEGAQRTVLNKTSIAFTVDNSAVVNGECDAGLVQDRALSALEESDGVAGFVDHDTLSPHERRVGGGSDAQRASDP